jgi:hypothetical protein
MGEIVAINQICNDIDNVAFVGYQIFEPERNIKRGHAMIRVPVSVNNKASMRAPTNSNQIAFHQLLSPLRTILLDTRKITAFLFGIDNIYGCYNGHGGIFFGLFFCCFVGLRLLRFIWRAMTIIARSGGKLLFHAGTRSYYRYVRSPP